MTDSTATHAALGALIRERREGSQLSMDELASQARVSRSTIHRIEHGSATRPTPAKLARVLSVVGITPENVRTILDDDEYIGDVVHWMDRAEAVETMGHALRARPHMRPLDGRPDLVVIDREAGTIVAEVNVAVADLMDRLAAMLEDAGYMVTRPR